MLMVCIVSAALPADLFSREPEVRPPVRWLPWEPYMYEGMLPEGPDAFRLSAAVDTYHLACYDFETMDWQGWSRGDRTAQPDTFFHVDNFIGLGGGERGFLEPIEGTQSMWCGVRPGDDFYMCGWQSAPGYGNSWDQWLQSDAILFTGMLTLSYHGRFDSEEQYDQTLIEYDASYGNWIEIAAIDGVVDTVAVHTIMPAQAATKLRFHFTSDGAWSDEDGLHTTDGACIIDSITVADVGGVIDFEDFESADIGAKRAGIWSAGVKEPYGMYSGLNAGLGNCDEDPCGWNSTSQIIFFEGSTDPYPPCPGLFTTPFCRGAGGVEAPCQHDMVYSPVIDLTRYSTGRDEVQDADIPAGVEGDLGALKMKFTVYQDLPHANAVYYNWMVREIHGGCPGPWQDISMQGGAMNDYWIRTVWLDIFVDAGETDSIQVGFWVRDYCDILYGVYSDCAEHTPSPYFDNIRVYRYSTKGPQWQYRAMKLFQDNFPSTDDIESHVRADMAGDIRPGADPVIDPGDSVVVTCWSPNAGGLDTLGTGEPRVYFHCNVHFLGPDGKPDLFGPQLEGTYGRYDSDDGDWTVLLMEPAATSSGSIAPDKYAVDLNDSLFTRGYAIEYYFKAFDLDGESTTLPEDAETVPPDPCLTGRDLFEFTCLPTLRVVPGLLYVDDFDGRGTREGLVQTYLDPTFDAVLHIPPDRYDVNQPSSMVGNGLGSRARHAHLSAAYECIIWDSGDLPDGTIISGELADMDKSDDVGALTAWLDDLLWAPTYPDCDGSGGLVIMGDNIAGELNGYADGRMLLNDWCATALVDYSYYEMTGGFSGGGIVNPLMAGIPGTPYDGLEFYLYGGCPGISDFNVIEAMGSGINALAYPDYVETPYYAGVLNQCPNSHGNCIATAVFGFSFMNIRNAGPGYLTRSDILNHTLRNWLVVGNAKYPYTDTEVPAVTEFAGIYPNPFNPATRVAFSLKKKGNVSLRVYDVSGRLVRVLIDEVREAGSYEVVWDGANDRGRRTASGIYFCRMEADDYRRTVKMVLLR